MIVDMVAVGVFSWLVGVGIGVLWGQRADPIDRLARKDRRR